VRLCVPECIPMDLTKAVNEALEHVHAQDACYLRGWSGRIETSLSAEFPQPPRFRPALPR
jgi:hypothetical protein